jgi:hypothetical protein
MNHVKFMEQLNGKFVVLSHWENTEISCLPKGEPSSLETRIMRHKVKNCLHWPVKAKELPCRLRPLKKEAGPLQREMGL